jgi:hypothetical protein
VTLGRHLAELGIPFWIAWLLALRLKPLETGPHRQVRGSPERSHSRLLEREGMDHEQRSTPPNRDWNIMTSSPTSGSTRQVARNKSLAWVSALTFGAGAAGVLGAAAMVVSAPSPTAATGTSAATLASGTSRNTGSTLQAAAAPATTNNPPVATSGAS